MPEIILILAGLLCLGITYIAFFSIDRDIPIGIFCLVIFIGLSTWEILANRYHKVESKKIYKVSTVSKDITNIRQIAITEDEIINITARINKIIDEEKCRLLITKYETFSLGVLMTFTSTKYSIVCPKIE